MTYSATYDQDDFQSIVVDGLGTAGASVVGWISLLVLLVILVYIVATFKRLGRVIPSA